MDSLLVVFQLKRESYGIDISRVQEIRVISAVTAMPNAPDYVEGAINLRGRVIPVIDMHSRFGQARTDRTKDTRIIVVNLSEGDWVGLIVDSVCEVLRLQTDTVEPPPPLVVTAAGDFVSGVAKVGEDRLVTLLDLDRLLPTTAAVVASPAF